MDENNNIVITIDIGKIVSNIYGNNNKTRGKDKWKNRNKNL